MVDNKLSPACLTIGTSKRNFKKSCKKLEPHQLAACQERKPSRGDRGDYRDWYDQDTRDTIAKHFAFEIETMGYRFEDPEPDRPIVRKI